jgi:hypothetical protein
MHFIGIVRLGLPCAKCRSEEHLGEGTANMGASNVVGLGRNGRRPEPLQRGTKLLHSYRARGRGGAKVMTRTFGTRSD